MMMTMMMMRRRRRRKRRRRRRRNNDAMNEGSSAQGLVACRQPDSSSSRSWYPEVWQVQSTLTSDLLRPPQNLLTGFQISTPNTPQWSHPVGRNFSVFFLPFIWASKLSPDMEHGLFQVVVLTSLSMRSSPASFPQSVEYRKSLRPQDPCTCWFSCSQTLLCLVPWTKSRQHFHHHPIFS